MPAIAVEHLRYAYDGHHALAGVSFDVRRGEIFALLGPNGGGKTTLFRVLCTLLRPAIGHVRVFGHDSVREPHAVRRRLGVVFQHPSLDPKLTVAENLRHHGHLYGLHGRALRSAAHAMLERFGLADRSRDRVETLSGGLQRRVELAKGLLHRPDLLLLDEPSTGLDPGARRDFVNYLAHVRERDGVTILLTTHFMDEAERCDRVAILHRGQLVALDTPDALKAAIGGDVVVVQTPAPEALRAHIRERFGGDPLVVDGTVRIERARGHDFVREVVEAFPGEVRSVTLGKPTLEDVFVHRTGHRFEADAPAAGAAP